MPETNSSRDARICQLHWSTTCILSGGYCSDVPPGDDELAAAGF